MFVRSCWLKPTPGRMRLQTCSTQSVFNPHSFGNSRTVTRDALSSWLGWGIDILYLYITLWAEAVTLSLNLIAARFTCHWVFRYSWRPWWTGRLLGLNINLLKIICLWRNRKKNLKTSCTDRIPTFFQSLFCVCVCVCVNCVILNSREKQNVSKMLNKCT